MPNRKAHRNVGAASGALIAGYRARAQRPPELLLETAGGALGGLLGGSLPDVLEPVISSWHRDIAHSWAAGAGIIRATSGLQQWESYCRERAGHYSRLRAVAQDPLFRALHFLAEIFWRLAAGFASGLGAGYASHLLLDALTPRGIPLMVR